MPTFRPNNLNKRSYPGNANVVGPTRQATLGITTTQCLTCTPLCGSCQFYALTLGQRCSYCARPCCQCVVGCNCTICTQTVPSGSWKISEQYSASLNGAWGSGSESSNTPPSFLCYTANSITDIGNVTDYYGNYYSAGRVASTFKKCNVNWNSRGEALTCNVGGSGWYIPSCSDLNTLATGRSYLSTCFRGGYFWSNTQYSANEAYGRYMFQSIAPIKPKSYLKNSGAIRNI